MGLREKVTGAFEEVKGVFELDFDVGLAVHDIVEDAKDAGANTKRLVRNTSSFDLDAREIQFVLDQYNYGGSEDSDEFLEGIMALGFGHFEYDCEQKTDAISEWSSAREIYSYFKSTKNALRRGFGPQIVKLLEAKYESPEFKGRTEQDVDEQANTYAMFAALLDKDDTGIFNPISRYYDIGSLIKAYNNPLSQDTINIYGFLLEPKIYRTEERFAEICRINANHRTLFNF